MSDSRELEKSNVFTGIINDIDNFLLYETAEMYGVMLRGVFITPIEVIIGDNFEQS